MQIIFFFSWHVPDFTLHPLTQVLPKTDDLSATWEEGPLLTITEPKHPSHEPYSIKLVL